MKPARDAVREAIAEFRHAAGLAEIQLRYPDPEVAGETLIETAQYVRRRLTRAGLRPEARGVPSRAA